MSDRTGRNSGESKQQLTSRMRQMQPLALLSPDLHRKSVVQSLTTVQSSNLARFKVQCSRVQSDLEAGSNSSSRFKRSIASLSCQSFRIVRITSRSEACAGSMSLRRKKGGRQKDKKRK